MTDTTGPIVEYDLQIAGLYFEGTESDDFEDLREDAKEDLEVLAELVEDLKEVDQAHERELREAMSGSDEPSGTGHYQ